MTISSLHQDLRVTAFLLGYVCSFCQFSLVPRSLFFPPGITLGDGNTKRSLFSESRGFSYGRRTFLSPQSFPAK